MTMKYKDYEYGWYGFIATMGCDFFNTGFYHKHYNSKGSIIHKYVTGKNNILKQLSKVSDVKFISGDYRDTV